MKSKEFKTSKGEFVIVDEVDTESLAMYKVFDNPKIFKYGLHLKPISKLSQITEDQAKEIVDEPEYIPCNNCLNGCPVCGGYGCSISFINELHSLIKSLGVHLYENPLGKLKDYKKDFKGHAMFYSNYIDKWNQAESLTFYNPYIFKKI